MKLSFTQLPFGALSLQFAFVPALMAWELKQLFDFSRAEIDQREGTPSGTGQVGF